MCLYCSSKVMVSSILTAPRLLLFTRTSSRRMEKCGSWVARDSMMRSASRPEMQWRVLALYSGMARWKRMYSWTTMNDGRNKAGKDNRNMNQKLRKSQSYQKNRRLILRP